MKGPSVNDLKATQGLFQFSILAVRGGRYLFIDSKWGSFGRDVLWVHVILHTNNPSAAWFLWQHKEDTNACCYLHLDFTKTINKNYYQGLYTSCIRTGEP